jgi:hypothetical protein
VLNLLDSFKKLVHRFELGSRSRPTSTMCDPEDSSIKPLRITAWVGSQWPRSSRVNGAKHKGVGWSLSL